MGLAERASVVSAALLLAGAVLPWVRWSTGDTHTAAPVGLTKIETAVLGTDSTIAWQVALHPAHLAITVATGLGLLALVVLGSGTRLTRLATAAIGLVAAAAAAVSLRALTGTDIMLVRIGDIVVSPLDVRPGLGLLLVCGGGIVATAVGVTGSVVGRVDPRHRERLAALFARVSPSAVATVGVLAVAAWYHVALLDLPIYRDIGAYLTMAQEILDGEVPYRDVVDHKPPGIYYLLAAVLAAGGDAATAKVIMLGVNLGVVGLLVLVGRELWDPVAGLYAGAAYLLVTPLYGGFKVQTEQFVALFSLAAILVALRYRGDRRPLAAAGALVGLATLFKQPGLATLGALGLFVVAAEFGDWRGLVRSLGAAVGGFLAPIAPVAAYFAAVGALDEFVFWSLTMNFGYTSHGMFPPAENVATQFDTMMRAWPVWLVAGIGVVLLLGDWWADRRPDPGELLVLSAGAAAMVVIAVRPWPHYLLHPYPFAGLLAGYAMHVTAGEFEASPEAIRAAFVATLLLTGVLVVPALEDMRTQAADAGLEDQRDVARLIDRHVDADDRLLVFPASPVYYYLLDTEPYGENIYYLRANRGLSYTNAGLLERIRRHPPDYVLIRQWECETIPSVCTYVRTNYELVEEYRRGVALYRRPGAKPD